MDIPELFSSMLEAYRETCRFLQARPQMPWNRRRIWVEAAENQVQAREVSVPSISSLSVPARTALFDVPGWRGTEAALKKHSVASRHFGEGFSIGGHSRRLDWPIVRLLILNELFFRTQSMEVDESAFTSLYSAFEDFLFASVITARVIAPLQGIRCSDRVVLKLGVVERLSTKE